MLDLTQIYGKSIKIGSIRTSDIELKDLVKAWLAISLAFAILFNGLSFDISFLFTFLMSGLTVGVGFLFHEMAHKIVAQKYGCFAEFRANNLMLGLAIAMSFLGFLFAAPGAVMISGYVDLRRNGIISLAGPLTNYILAMMFLVGSLFFTSSLFYFGFYINSWLGLFNLIPFLNFDGKKIMVWNNVVYGIMVIVGLLFVFGVTKLV